MASIRYHAPLLIYYVWKLVLTREGEKKHAQTQFSVALKFISSLPEYHVSNDKKHEFVLRNFRFAFNAGIKTN